MHSPVLIHVAQRSLTHAGQGHGADYGSGGGIASPFVAVEEKQPVFDNRPPERPAEGVTDQRRARQTGTDAVAEEIVRLEEGAAIKLEKRSVEIVRAASGHKVHLSRRGTPLVRVRVERCYAELLDGLRVQPQHRGLERVCLRLIDVHTVQGDVRLVAARAGHIAVLGDAGLQGKQRLNVACLEWKLDDLLRHEVVAEGSILSVDRNRTRTGLHRYHLVHLADLHLDRDVGRASDQGLHLVQDLLAEPGNLYLQRIIAGRDQLKTERTRFTCDLRAAEIGGRILDRDTRAGDEPPLRIHDTSANC